VDVSRSVSDISVESAYMHMDHIQLDAGFDGGVVIQQLEDVLGAQVLSYLLQEPLDAL
jgi:hypothetical protein